MSNRITRTWLFSELSSDSQTTPAEVQCGKEKHSARDRTCWKGLFWKIHRSLRGNGPNVRTDVESDIERTQSCYKNSVICLTKCASPPQFRDWQECLCDTWKAPTVKWLFVKIYRDRIAYLGKKKDRQINSLVFLSWFLNSYKVQHTQLLSLAPGTMPEPSYHEAVTSGKWINFIIWIGFLLFSYTSYESWDRGARAMTRPLQPDLVSRLSPESLYHAVPGSVLWISSETEAKLGGWMKKGEFAGLALPWAGVTTSLLSLSFLLADSLGSYSD